jgi:SAM-dependent methyltransferase
MSANEGIFSQEQTYWTAFTIEDLQVFDDDALRHVVSSHSSCFTIQQFAHSLQGGPEQLLQRIEENLPARDRPCFLHEVHRMLPGSVIEDARRQVLGALFWELTYWKTPELYEELTEGELLHPGIFQNLAPDLRDKIVLDAGAGTGRASMACLESGASVVYAIEPSPGLRRIMERKCARWQNRLVISPGRFDALPLEQSSVDVALACSAFTAMPGQGGEPGLAELRRVTRPGGMIVLIWPRQEDQVWLTQHGFQYVSLPIQQEMQVHFRSMHSAMECAQRFYGYNQALKAYLLAKQQPDVPFSLLQKNPPHEYCWLRVEK